MTRPSIPPDRATGTPPSVAPARASGPHAGSAGASAIQAPQAPRDGTRQTSRSSPQPCITASPEAKILAVGRPDPVPGARLRAVRAPGRGRAQASAGSEPDTSSLPAGRKAIAAAMSEDRGPDSLDAHVRKLMKDLGLTGFHVEKSLDVEKNRKNVSVKGWPDWTIRGPRGVLFRELKSQRGRVEPEQREWLDALAADGADVDVWRPEDLLSGRVARELAALAGLRGAT